MTTTTHTDPVIAWFGPLTGNLAAMPRTEMVSRLLTAAAELADESLVAALAAISAEFGTLSRFADAIDGPGTGTTVHYLRTNADEYNAFSHRDVTPPEAMAYNWGRIDGKYEATVDALRVLDIAGDVFTH